MIKVMAFDLVGVLVSEKDIMLTNEEEKLERSFGPNISDADYMKDASKIVDDEIILKTTENIIDKLYSVRDKDLFKKIKELFPNIKIVIATNHVSFIRSYIDKAFNRSYLDDVIISAEIHKIKPTSEFYNFLLDKFKIKPNELLFLDDNLDNVEGAKRIGINSIKVNKDTDLLEEIKKEMYGYCI